MAKSKPATPKATEARPMLVVDRETVRAKIAAQMANGNELLRRQFDSMEAFKPSQKEFYRWEEYVYELLGSLFTTDRYATELGGYHVATGPYPALREEVEHYRDDLQHYIQRLQSLLDRLELIPEDPAITKSLVVSEAEPLPDRNKLFI